MGKLVIKYNIIMKISIIFLCILFSFEVIDC